MAKIVAVVIKTSAVANIAQFSISHNLSLPLIADII